MENHEYIDDPAIPNSEDLWRRIHPLWAVPDNNSGGWRVSSAAFDDSTDGSPLSVLLATVVAKTHRTADDVITHYAGYFLASITAGTAREYGQGIDPTPTPDEPAHASVFGKKTASIKRNLATRAKWVIAPS